ncbi:hypothetical protein D9615_008041 [Tricholomella constricta]|uniref:Uncharacterized protein n=1 Tax=Tricholomella constricta TaxID=117010 RepID=A0A8H5GVU3_9AGAR|nr:hypothetical protein D9615_008041 [Tricholomella constricta]
MDVVSSIQSLCTLAASILIWIDQTREKEETLVAISGTVARISSILTPFQNATNIDPMLVDAFMGLGDILSRTKEHLFAHGKQRRRSSINGAIAFLMPAQVTKLLNQDEQQLTHQLTVILFALATISFFRTHYPLTPKSAECFAVRSAQHEDVLEFWRDYLGAKVLYARTDRFSDALRLCFGDWLSEAARRRLALRLDEFRVGGVAISSLERFVGDGSLEQAIHKFKAFDSLPSAVETRSDSKLPLLIWVDDNPSNNVQEVTFARTNGVNVLEFTSTALVKLWIQENEEFLRENDTAGSIRFISDTARLETDSGGGADSSVFFNITAGENIARYLRGHLYRAPVLIFCGAGIIHTQYVESYEATGSTCHSTVVRNYIAALSDRREDDKSWCGYNLV